MLELLIVQMLNGGDIHINPREIVSMVEARAADDPGKHYTDKVKCIINLTNGKTITTEEDCDHIEERLRAIVAKRIEEMRKQQ
jgi:uncharacterized protein YlzI (FlbEa/FlbD family)